MAILGARGRRISKIRNTPREGTVTYQVWHRFVNNIGVQIDILQMAKELGTKDIHSKIEIINNNYRLDIRRVGRGIFVLDEI